MGHMSLAGVSLRDLEYVVAVADCASFVAAADHCRGAASPSYSWMDLQMASDEWATVEGDPTCGLNIHFSQNYNLPSWIETVVRLSLDGFKYFLDLYGLNIYYEVSVT